MAEKHLNTTSHDIVRTRRTEQRGAFRPACQVGGVFARDTFLVALMAAGLLMMYSIFLFDRPTISRLAREDGLAETLGAMFFLAGAALFFVTFLRSGQASTPGITPQRKTRRNLLYLALSMGLLFAFLEEISWGQRFLGIDAPAVFAARNTQGETNIHNLQWFHGTDAEGNRKPFWHLLLNMDRLFSIFWFTLCVCVPLVSVCWARGQRLLARLRVPVCPVVFAVLFVGNYAVSRLIPLLPGVRTHWAVEVKEANIAFLFMCVAIGQLRRTGSHKSKVRAVKLPRQPGGGRDELKEGAIPCNL